MEENQQAMFNWGNENDQQIPVPKTASPYCVQITIEGEAFFVYPCPTYGQFYSTEIKPPQQVRKNKLPKRYKSLQGARACIAEFKTRLKKHHAEAAISYKIITYSEFKAKFLS